MNLVNGVKVWGFVNVVGDEETHVNFEYKDDKPCPFGRVMPLSEARERWGDKALFGFKEVEEFEEGRLMKF